MAQPQVSQELKAQTARSDSSPSLKTSSPKTASNLSSSSSSPKAASNSSSVPINLPSAQNLPHCTESRSLLDRIKKGQLMMVDSRRRNGLILYKKYHAEFAGPGAAIGGCIDLDCEDVLPVGSLLLLEPTTHEERQKAYLIRRQWIRLTYQFTDNKAPLKRAQMILNQFETYFDRETIAQVPDSVFAKLVGVLPHTVQVARRPKRKMKQKNKS